MSENFTDFAKTTLSSGITDSATSIAVVDGSQFPTANFSIVIGDGSTREIVYCTSRSGNTITASERGTHGSIATAHSSGVAVVCTVLAHHLNNFVGAELAYAESNVQQGSITNTLTDITGLQIDFTVVDRAVDVIAFLPWVLATTTSTAPFAYICHMDDFQVRAAGFTAVANNDARGLYIQERITEPGDYERKVAVIRVAGTGSITVGVNTNSHLWAFIKAVEV